MIMSTSMSTNLTNSSNSSYHDSARISKAVAMFTFGGVGILNNAFIILLATKYTQTKNLHHLIINMAVSDITIVLAEIVLFVNHEFVNIWSALPRILSQYLCTMLLFLAHVSVLVSAISLLIVSIERFRVTRLTLLRLTPYTLKQRVAMIACTWLACMALGSFALVYGQVIEDEHGDCICSIDKVHSIWEVAYFMTPSLSLCANVVLSVLTLRTLEKAQDIHDSIPETQRCARARQTSRIVQMVLCSVCLYSCCYLPSFAHKLLGMIDKSFVKLSSDGDFILHTLLPTINSCFGPWIYVVFLNDFLQAAKKVFCDVCNITRKVNQQPEHEMVDMSGGAVIKQTYSAAIETGAA